MPTSRDISNYYDDRNVCQICNIYEFIWKYTHLGTHGLRTIQSKDKSESLILDKVRFRKL